MRFNVKFGLLQKRAKGRIGKGRAALLRAIKEHNSLKKADELNMSYRAAWERFVKPNGD